jgi:hypothetical protein
MSKVIKVEVTLIIEDDADAFDVVENCDYAFSHESIQDHEITGLFNENNQTIFSA